jgi:hypothetical protein
MNRNLGLVLLASLAVLVVCLGARATSSTSPPNTTATHESRELSGTIRAVNARARTIDVITGVGHSLRIYRMQIAPATLVRARQAALPLERLKPGTVVRVSYQLTRALPTAPPRLDAIGIEVLPMSSDR